MFFKKGKFVNPKCGCVAYKSGRFDKMSRWLTRVVAKKNWRNPVFESSLKTLIFV